MSDSRPAGDGRSSAEGPTTWNGNAERRRVREFVGVVDEVARMRHFVGETTRGWGFGDVAALAELLVSELVTNSVRCGADGGSVTVVARPAGLRVEVVDDGPGEPRVKAHDSAAPSGRGLQIVDRLARRWGVERSEPCSGPVARKLVWFELEDIDPVV